MIQTTKSRFVVLHMTKHSDSSAVIHTVDSAAGRKSYLVRGLGKKRQSAEFHPLNILDGIGAESPKSSLAVLREWNPVVSLEEIRSNIYKSSTALFISEVLFRSIRTETTDASLFDWLCDAVARLEATEGNAANFHLWFLVSYIVKLGFGPSEATLEQMAGAIEPQGLFDRQEMELFEKILHSSLEETLAIPLSASRRQSFSKTLIRYLSYHLGAELNIKSLPVLHELFL